MFGEPFLVEQWNRIPTLPSKQTLTFLPSLKVRTEHAGFSNQGRQQFHVLFVGQDPISFPHHKQSTHNYTPWCCNNK
jgi:hypothetical protein